MRPINLQSFTDYQDQDFDALLMIETSNSITTFTNHHHHRYEPTLYQDILKTIQIVQQKQLYNDNIQHNTLVDFGSGLLRVPITYHYFLNFRTKGIELNKQLYLFSLKNLSHYQQKHQHATIDILNMDALNYKFNPMDTHLFFFNPFSEHIFKKIIERYLTMIQSTIDSNHPLKYYIILYFPSMEYETIMSFIPQFKCIETLYLDDYDIDAREKVLFFQFQNE